MNIPNNRIVNPTDEQRHEVLRNSLENAGRPEDYDYILSLLSPPPDITNYASLGELKGIKIGIIGGGLAGMSAAFELRKLGADITILEASPDRIGGRVYTYYFDEEGNYYGEFGAHRIPVSHEATWHYINLFGLNTISLSPPVRNNFYYVHNTRFRVSESVEKMLYPKYELTQQERNTPWPELQEYAFGYLLKQLPPNIRSELIRIQPTFSPEYMTAMSQSVRQTFEKLGLSQGAISLISGIDPGTGALLNISYSELIGEEYTFDRRNTYSIQGGIVNLPLAFYHSLLSDTPTEYRNISNSQLGTVTYKPDSLVNGIYQSGYRDKVVVKYKSRKEAKDIADIYDFVICTIPFSTLRTVEIKPYFSNIKMQAILELNYINAQKTLFMCKHRFWERNTEYGNMLGGISLTDLPIQSIFYPTDHNFCPTDNPCSPEEPGVLTASYNYTSNATRVGSMENSIRYELIRQNVEEVHGLPRGYLNTLIDDFKTLEWNAEADFRGGITLAFPGQKELFAYEMQQPEYNNHLFFAGEHISNKHAWMQGALSSGMLAANMLAYCYHNQ
jgi:monoamine oxidase